MAEEDKRKNDEDLGGAGDEDLGGAGDDVAGVKLCIAFMIILSAVTVIAATTLASRNFFSSPEATYFRSSSYITSSKHLRTSHHFPAVLSNTVFNGKDQTLMEQGLSRARAAIRQKTSPPANISLNVYLNAPAFYRSYSEMEKRFKVYIYEDGQSPLIHGGPCKSIYASEGRFMQEMEFGANVFRTKNPHLAHVFYMPFSVTFLVKYLYNQNTDDIIHMKKFVSNYIQFISTKYPFWNRTQGADHFMLACHDWGPRLSSGNPFLFNTSIRVLCNANSSEGFNPRKDVTLPEVHLIEADLSPKIQNPPPPNTPRPILAFFAGGNHGYIRTIMLEHWKGNDPDLQVHEYLPKGVDYYTFMLQSKFCLCPSGYEVASPRIVESIYTECVPVIISDHFVLPFSDVLNWEAFSVKVEVAEIPRLKEVLLAIPEDKYLRLKQGLRAVRKHFMFNKPAQRFDVFHMVLHSIWLRRINLSFE